MVSHDTKRLMLEIMCVILMILGFLGFSWNVYSIIIAIATVLVGFCGLWGAHKQERKYLLVFFIAAIVMIVINALAFWSMLHAPLLVFGRYLLMILFWIIGAWLAHSIRGYL